MRVTRWTEIASGAPSGSPGAAALSGPITVLAEGGDPSTEPALKVYDDFKTQNPAIEWDIRAIPGLGPEWDRLARAALESGEPVGLVMLDGLFVRAWARDGLLADLGAEPRLAEVLARVPAQFHLGGLGEGGARAFPLAVTRGVQTTGIYYNKALLDRAGLEPPKTIADLKAMVKPLAALGVAPLVHSAGDASFNPLLVMWLLPMIAERTGDPLAFVESTIKGEVALRQPRVDRGLRDYRRPPRRRASCSDGSGATDYATMQLLFLQGKAAMTYNGTWLLEALQAGTPTVPFDLHVAPLPLVDGASKAHSILAWAGFALPAKVAASRDSVYAFLEYASRPEVDASRRRGSPGLLADRRVECRDPRRGAREFLPMFEDAITSAQLALGAGDRRRDRQPGPGPREGHDGPRLRRRGDPGRRGRSSSGGSQLLPLTASRGPCHRRTGHAATVAPHAKSAARDEVLCPEAAKRPRATAEPDRAACSVAPRRS